MLANTTHLLQVCGHYTLEFREWIARPAHTQTYAYLKMFIQEAYSCRLQLAGQTTGEAGFAGAALEEESDDETMLFVLSLSAWTPASMMPSRPATNLGKQDGMQPCPSLIFLPS